MSDMLLWRSRSSMGVGQMFCSTTSTFPYAYAYAYAYAYDNTEAHYASAGRLWVPGRSASPRDPLPEACDRSQRSRLT